MVPSRLLPLTLALVACGEVAPVSLLGDAGAPLWRDDASTVDASVPKDAAPSNAIPDAAHDASPTDATPDAAHDASPTDATPDAAHDASPTDATPDAAHDVQHVCRGAYPIAFSCLSDLPGCTPCAEGFTCCQADAY